MTNNPKHVHECVCGDYYVCSQRDNCPNDWQCPACEMAERDRDISADWERMQNTHAILTKENMNNGNHR